MIQNYFRVGFVNEISCLQRCLWPQYVHNFHWSFLQFIECEKRRFSARGVRAKCGSNFAERIYFFKTKSIITSLFDIWTVYVLKERVQLSLCFLVRLRYGFSWSYFRQENVCRNVLAKCFAKWPIRKIKKNKRKCCWIIECLIQF